MQPTETVISIFHTVVSSYAFPVSIFSVAIFKIDRMRNLERNAALCHRLYMDSKQMCNKSVCTVKFSFSPQHFWIWML